MSLHQWSVAGESLLWMLAVFVPLQWAFPARRQALLRPRWWVDLAFFLGQRLLFAALAVDLIGHGSALLPEATALRAWSTSLPLWVQALLASALGDLLVYGGHRLQHAWEPLWRFHAVHHTAEHLDFLAAHREHPLDGLYTQTLMNLPALALGLRIDAFMGLVAFRALWAIFIHSNVRVPLGPLRYLVGAPELHHHHHARDRHAGNYANLAPWIDALFGTLHVPEGEPEPVGLNEPHPRSYLGLLAVPLLPRHLGARWIAWEARQSSRPRRAATSAGSKGLARTGKPRLRTRRSVSASA